jgi:hypothetical protein
MAGKMATKILRMAACLGAGVVLFGSTAQSAHRPRVRHGAAAQAPPQIACTFLGCGPIPAACTPVAGKTPGGIPTGYDVIVCPPGVWPLK